MTRAHFNGLHISPWLSILLHNSKEYTSKTRVSTAERIWKGIICVKIFFIDNIIMHAPRDHRFHVLPIIENSAVSSFGRKSARLSYYGNNVGLRLIGIDLPSASRMLYVVSVSEKKLRIMYVLCGCVSGSSYFIRQIDKNIKAFVVRSR